MGHRWATHTVSRIVSVGTTTHPPLSLQWPLNVRTKLGPWKRQIGTSYNETSLSQKLLQQVRSARFFSFPVSFCRNVVVESWNLGHINRLLVTFFSFRLMFHNSYALKNATVLFRPIVPDFRKSVAFWRIPKPRPFVLLVRATCKMSMDHWWYDIDREKLK
jgi:hypothetical protein